MKKKATPNQFTERAGFTLLEVLIAVTVFAIGILAANAMQLTSVSGNSAANLISESAAWATDKTEELLSLPYDDLEDTNLDGTDQDNDYNGTDDNGDNFGLDEAVNPDGTVTKGNYTIQWNVAVDHPFPGNKTIRITTTSQSKGMSKSVSLTYIKADSV